MKLKSYYYYEKHMLRLCKIFVLITVFNLIQINVNNTIYVLLRDIQIC